MERAVWARGILSGLLSVVLLSGCGATKTHGPKGGAAGGASGDASTGSAGKTGSSVGGAGSKSSSSGGSTQMCYVDYPCQNAFRCIDSEHYQAQTTDWDCHNLCGPGPCSGATCQLTGSPIACPAGTQCVAMGGFDDVAMGCQAIPDAGARDAQGADRGVKPPLDAFTGDVAAQPDTLRPDVVPCVPGDLRCDGPAVEKCSTEGRWQYSFKTCDYACRAGICIGECEPGFRRRCRATGNTPQTCDSAGTWVDEAACSGTTPYCATGQCVAACLDEGQDCSASTSACCAGSECVSTDASNDILMGSTKFVCKAIPACVALGAACSANTDCCAGLDCTAGKCAAKQTACLDAPAAGVCGGSSGATCCPGTECATKESYDPQGCEIPPTIPKEGGCPRERPAFHEACRAAKFGLNCVYSDWVKQPGYFYDCTCSYHGWSCTVGHYVH